MTRAIPRLSCSTCLALGGVEVLSKNTHQTSMVIRGISTLKYPKFGCQEVANLLLCSSPSPPRMPSDDTDRGNESNMCCMNSGSNGVSVLA